MADSLARGAQMNSTAMHLAAMEGHAGAVYYLLAGDADTSLKDRNGKTAMDLAEEKGRERVIKVLKEGKPAKTTPKKAKGKGKGKKSNAYTSTPSVELR